MKRKKAVACRLDLDFYGVMPCNSWVEARRIEQGFAVYVGADVELIPEPLHVANSKESYSWRAFAKSLLGISDGWIEPDACDHVQVKGETGIRADILRIAWSQDRNTTDWLLAQTDVGLKILEAQFPSLVDKESREFLDSMLDAINQLDAEPQLERLHSAFTSDAATMDIHKIYNEMEKRICWINDVIQRDREQRLAPFLSDIIRIASQFDDTPHRGGGIQAPSQRQRVATWLRHYVEKHGQLPEGKHEVSIPFFGGRLSAGLIDFSKFR